MSSPSSSSDAQLSAHIARAPASGGDQLIVTLNPNDVIFGRGAGYCQFSGNKKFRQIVSQMKDTYKQTDTKGKDKIARYIIDYIHKQLNGRFLKATEEQKQGDESRVWQIVTHKEAMEKTKQALRERKNEEHEKRVALRFSQQNDFDPSSVASAQVPMAGAAADRQQQTALLNLGAASSIPYQARSAASQRSFQPTQSFSNAWFDPSLHGQVVPDARQAAAARLSVHLSVGVNNLLQQEFDIFAGSMVRHTSDLFTNPIVRNSLQNITPLQNTARHPSHTKRPLEQDTTNTIRSSPSVTTSGHFASQPSAQKQPSAGAIEELGQNASARISLANKRMSSDEISEQKVRAGVIQDVTQNTSTTTSPIGEQISSGEVSELHAQKATATTSLAGKQVGSDQVHESAAIGSAASALVDILDTTTDQDVNNFLMSALLEDVPDAPRITQEQQVEERAHLSAEEKEAMLADVFGKLCQVSPLTKRLKRGVDDATCVLSLLKDMKAEIDNMPIIKKMALLEARQKAAAKEFSDERMILFLRRDDMNAAMAARRFVKYWEKRRQWFGADKFCLPMTQSGALRDDLVALRCGYLSLLDDLDASGRQIMVLRLRLNTFEGYSAESLVRSWWYMMEVISEHVNADKGLVFVNWCLGSTIWNIHRKAKGFNAVIDMEMNAWPIKFMALHMWRQNRFVALTMRPIVVARMDKRFRCRMIDHDSDEDVMRVMESYGISGDILPIEMGGKSKYDQSEWLVRRQRFEDQRDAGCC